MACFRLLHDDDDDDVVTAEFFTVIMVLLKVTVTVNCSNSQSSG